MAIIVVFADGIVKNDITEEGRKITQRLTRMAILGFFVKAYGITDRKLMMAITEQSSYWSKPLKNGRSIYICRINIPDLALKNACIYAMDIENGLYNDPKFFSEELDEITKIEDIHNFSFLGEHFKDTEKARWELLTIPSYRFVVCEGPRACAESEKLSRPFVKRLN